MPDLNGIELAGKIRNQTDSAVIIFITQYENFAFEAFKVSAAQYIQKPIKEKIFFPILDQVIPSLKKDRYYLLSTPHSIVNILFSSIICVEFVNRKLKFYLENGTILESKSLQTSFSKAMAPLLADSRFFRVHQAFVVNISHVTELKIDSFVAKSDIIIPIPRTKYVEAKRKYLSFHNITHVRK
jgi:DNA-binding LytR/AlgR family response regulator